MRPADVAAAAATSPEHHKCSQAACERVPDAKVFATLQARGALRGFCVVESSDDRDRVVYIASKWGLTRSIASLNELSEWLRRVGA